MTDRIHLGFEVETGVSVSVPLHHAIVSGVTGLSGKTTAISAMLSRLPDGYRSLVFSTKRGEIQFEGAHEVQPFYKATVDWEYVVGVLEAARKERLKFERSWIIKASRGAVTLRDVYDNIVAALEDGKPLRGLDESVWTVLRAYFEKVLPELESQPWASSLDLVEGVNVMRLEHLSEEVQGLVIAASLEEAHRAMANMILVIPEAWAYVPQQRGSPVKWAAQHIIRQGRARGVFLWLDSQDVTTVSKDVLKSVDLWVLGRQREVNEVRRILDQVPATQKPKASDVMTLGVGTFYVAAEDWVKKVYVQPQWLDKDQARRVALGEFPAVARPSAEGLVPVLSQTPQLVSEMLSAEDCPVSPYRIPEFLSHTLSGEPGSPEEDPVVIADLRDQLDKLQIAHDAHVADIPRMVRERDSLQEKVDQLESRLAEAEAERQRLTAELEGARRLRQALRQLLGTAWIGEHGDGPAPVDEGAIVEKVLARIGTERPVVQVAPIEAIKHRFQQETVERLVAETQALQERPRQAILWLLSVGKQAHHREICRQLGIPTAGGSFVKFGLGIKEAVAAGFLEDSREGLRVTIHEKLATYLAPYNPSPEDTEASYQHLLAALAVASTSWVDDMPRD